jgi:hypothetical protein
LLKALRRRAPKHIAGVPALELVIDIAGGETSLLSGTPIATSDVEPPPYRAAATGFPYLEERHATSMSHGDPASFADAPYAWTESALTEVFFIIATAVAVPVWIARVGRSFNLLGPSCADRFRFAWCARHERD